MSKLISSKQELNELVQRNKNVLVLFYASWCYFSNMFLPIFEKHATTGDYCRVLTDELTDCAETYFIETVPTVIFFQNGNVTRRLDAEPGEGLSEKQLTEMAAACGMKRNTKQAKRAGHIWSPAGCP